MKILHDNTGTAPSWFLDKVCFLKKSKEHKTAISFLTPHLFYLLVLNCQFN